MQTSDSVKEAVTKFSSVNTQKNILVRFYSKIIVDRHIQDFGISIGSERFIQLWCPDDTSALREIDHFEKWFEEEYPDAVFLLFTPDRVRKVARSSFFYS